MVNSIKSDYPIIMNDTELPFFPTSWERSPNKIQNTNQSEGGRDIIQKIRSDKMSISASFAIADANWARFFEELNELDALEVKEYSPRLNAYRTMTCRMEGFSISARRKSEELNGIYGVWDISFTLEEF